MVEAKGFYAMTASVLGNWLGAVLVQYQAVGFAETSDVAAAVDLGNKPIGCCYELLRLGCHCELGIVAFLKGSSCQVCILAAARIQVVIIYVLRIST